uniref:Uncharacterized protein n=1 Tax=Timema genevievae TaxID=629358 RepID=A0A7R9K1H4_TIMGE|nr:unnamed protein product [Timema genevievae]
MLAISVPLRSLGSFKETLQTDHHRASSAQGASTPGGKSHGTPPTSLATRSATMFSKSSSVGGAKRNKDKRRSSRGKAERDSNPQSTASTAVTPTTTTTTQWYMASPLPCGHGQDHVGRGDPRFRAASGGDYFLRYLRCVAIRHVSLQNGPTKNGTCLSLARGQLTPKRPLRSEVERERRLSRPSSGQFPPTRLSTTGANTTTARFNGSSSNRDSIGHCGRHVDMFPCKTPKLVFQGHCGGHVPLQDTPTGVSRWQLSPEARYFQADEAATLTLNPKASELPPVHTPHFVTLVLVTSCELTTHLLDSRLARIRPALQSQDWTTDSTASEEDGAPPPLPQKTREADYCNLPDDADRESESVRAPATPRIRNKPPPPPEPLEGFTPPHPTPKKPPLKPPTS